MEKWLPIFDCDSRYEISDMGRIKNKKTNRVRKSKIDKYGYEAVSLLTNANSLKTFRVHRLVLSAFDPNENSAFLHVDHIDGNPLNNKLENLQWMMPILNTASRAKEPCVKSLPLYKRLLSKYGDNELSIILSSLL